MVLLHWSGIGSFSLKLIDPCCLVETINECIAVSTSHWLFTSFTTILSLFFLVFWIMSKSWWMYVLFSEDLLQVCWCFWLILQNCCFIAFEMHFFVYAFFNFFLISQCKGKCLTDFDFWLDKNDCPLSEFIALVCVCVCVFLFCLQLHFSVSFIELSVHTWMELTSHYVFYLSVFSFEREDNESFFETHNWCLTEREKKLRLNV